MIFKDNTKGLTGDIIEAKEVILDALNPSYSLPEGYYDSGTIIKIVPEELKVSPSVNTEEYVPTEGKVISSVVVNKVTGNATANDVLTGKTFNSENGIGITGKIPMYNNIAQVLAPNNPSYIIREGYYGDNCDVSVAAQDITITAGTSDLTVHTTDMYYKNITVKPTPSEEKTVSFTNANYGEQVIEPSDGKLLKRVHVPGITLKKYTATLQTDEFTEVASNGVLYNKIKIPAVPGTATTGAVLQGYTFSSKNGINKSGTMKAAVGVTLDTPAVTADASYTYFSIPMEAYYTTGSKIRTANTNLRSYEVGRVNHCLDEGSSVANFCTLSCKNYTKLTFNAHGYANFNASKFSVRVYGCNSFNDGASFDWYGNPCSGTLIGSYTPTGGQITVDVTNYDYVYFGAKNGNDAYAGVELRHIKLS